MLDILSIGEAKIDIYLQVPENDPHFKLDEKRDNLLLSYGRKIEVENYTKELGGNACNTAVGLARLGNHVGLAAEIGDDEFSHFIVNSLEKENLNINLLKKDSKPTSFSICINYKGERTILSEHTKRVHNLNFMNTTAPIIYLTSLGEDWQKVYENCLKLVEEENKVLAFNPGTLQINDRGKLVRSLISKSDYLFINREEAQVILFGKDSKLNQEQNEIEKILFGLKSMGSKNVIVTDGLNGSFLTNEANKTYHLPILKVEVVEKTGAGDAYTAGFLAAIINGKGVEEAMVWGGMNSASVVLEVGAQKGLLKKGELLDKLTSMSNLKPSLL